MKVLGRADLILLLLVTAHIVLGAARIPGVVYARRLGDVEAGVVAAITTPATSVVLGGAMCLAGSSFSRLPCRTSCASARRAETRVAV